jgi:hypothetical protein
VRTVVETTVATMVVAVATAAAAAMVDAGRLPALLSLDSAFEARRLGHQGELGIISSYQGALDSVDFAGLRPLYEHKWVLYCRIT